MGRKQHSVSAWRVTAATLAACVFAGSAAAGPYCAGREDTAALRAAALRQQLMVAALTCHQADSFNRFVTLYRGDFLDSDQALKRYFARENGSGADDAYNAYKTRLANDSSLRSLHDPQFCRAAAIAFDIALSRSPALSELVSDRTIPIRTGLAGCDGEDLQSASVAEPAAPARHRDPFQTPSEARLASAAPMTASPQQQQQAAPAYTPPPQQQQATPSYYYVPPPTYQDAAAYAPYGTGWTPPPASPRQVQGADGRWYLLTPGRQ